MKSRNGCFGSLKSILLFFSWNLSAALFLTSCSIESSSKQASAQEKFVRTKLECKESVKNLRIVSLSPSTTEIIGTFTAPGTLVGRTAACNYPSEVKKVPIAGNIKPSYEQLVSLKPDLIVYDPILYSQSDIEKIRSLKIETLSISSKNIEAFLDSLGKLKKRIGPNIALADYIFNIRKRMIQISKTTPSKKIKASVLFEYGAGNKYLLAGKHTFIGDLLKQIGIEYIGPSTTYFDEINVEYLIIQNPDILITTTAKYKAISKDKRLSCINAIKKKRIFEINPDILLRAGARLDKLIDDIQNIIKNQEKYL